MGLGSLKAKALSLDGGGVRGVCELVCLKHIMHNLELEMKPPPTTPLLPCDYFDVIGGTSTGGLIAVMLGVLRMDIDSCITAYVDLAKEIFPHENFISRNKVVKVGKALAGKCRFDSTVLENNIKKLVRENLKKLPEYQNASDQELENVRFDFETINGKGGPKCKVFVCTFDKSTESTFRLRNYTSTEPSTQCTIWQALRATSAAPLIFGPITFGFPVQAEYVDGGLGMNNPIRAVIEEAEVICKRNANMQVGFVLSLGTGVPSLHSMGDTAQDLVETLGRISTETETTAEEFEGEMKRLAQTSMFRNAGYFRFNVAQGIGDVPLEEWKAITKMYQATNRYMIKSSDVVQACVKSMANSTGVSIVQSLLQSALIPINSTLFGRDDNLEYINAVVNPVPTSSIRHSARSKRGVVLWGLPGFGKTQLALHHILNHQNDYQLILWINATSSQTQLQSLRQIQNILHLTQPEINRTGSWDSTDLSGLVAQTFAFILTSLPLSDSKPWLLVVDGLEERNLDIRHLIPNDPQCKVLVTTPNNKIAYRLETEFEILPIEISAISEEDGAEMLLRLQQRRNHTESDKYGARRIARLLGGAPLALEQAAAMLLTPLSYQAYLNLYHVHFKKCRDFELYGLGISYEKHRSIFASLDMLYTKLVHDKEAVRLLQLSSFFGNDRILLSILSIPRLSSNVGQYSFIPWLRDFLSDPSLKSLALMQIRTLCLVDVVYDTSGEIQFYTLQTLVRAWIRAMMSPQEREEFSVVVFLILGEYLANNGFGWELSGRSPGFIHILAAIEDVEQEIPQSAWQPPDGAFFVSCAPFAHIFGRFCFALGQYGRARRFFTWSIDFDRIYPTSGVLGRDERLLVRERLGVVCKKLNDLPEALEHLSFVNAERARQSSPDDPLSLRSVSELRHLRDRLAELEQAAGRMRIARQEQNTRDIKRPLSPPPPPYESSGHEHTAEAGPSTGAKTRQPDEILWTLRYGNHNGARTPGIASISWYRKNKLFTDIQDLPEEDGNTANPPDDSEVTDTESSEYPPDYEATFKSESMPGDITIAQIPNPLFTINPNYYWSNMPKDMCMYYLMTEFPNPTDKSDEQYEVGVVNAIEERARSLGVQAEVIVNALSAFCSHYFHIWTPLKALRAHKLLSVYLLTYSEDCFEEATAALSSWFLVYTRIEEMEPFGTWSSCMSLSTTLLNNYLRPHERSGTFPWLLHQAVVLRLAPLVQRLLACGANPNAQDSLGCTPFELAAGRSCKVATEEMRHLVIKHLVDYGANIQLQTAIDADDYMVVDFWMSHYRNQQDDMGRTALHHAVQNKNDVVLDWLSHFEADASITDKDGWTPLHLASQRGYYDTAKFILRRFAVSGYSIQDKGGNAPLHLAVLNGHIDLICLLLSFGADICQQDLLGHSPLDLMMSMGYSSDLVDTFLQSKDTFLQSKGRMNSADVDDSPAYEEEEAGYHSDDMTHTNVLWERLGFDDADVVVFDNADIPSMAALQERLDNLRR